MVSLSYYVVALSLSVSHMIDDALACCWRSLEAANGEYWLPAR